MNTIKYERDCYGLITNTSDVDCDDMFDLFSEEEQSEEYKRYIRHIHWRLVYMCGILMAIEMGAIDKLNR